MNTLFASALGLACASPIVAQTDPHPFLESYGEDDHGIHLAPSGTEIMGPISASMTATARWTTTSGCAIMGVRSGR